ncbi:MAG: hypothetical protein ABL903_11565 [Methylococcales bacterium]
MLIKHISSLKPFRSLTLLTLGSVTGCLLLACVNQIKVDAYENIQKPPDLQITSSHDTQPSKNDTLLIKGLSEQIKLNENTLGPILLLSLDKNTALQVLVSALEYHHIEIIDQNHEQDYVLIQIKNEKSASARADSADEHYGSDGIYSSGEGFLDNVSSLWTSKTETANEDIIRYKLSAKQKESTTFISAHQLATGASFKKPNVEHQKQLFLMLYKSLREGFATK